MSFSEQIPKIVIVGLLIGGVGVVVNNMMSGSSDAAVVDVEMPGKLSAKAVKGKRTFSENCAACHGENGAGSEQGPPLIHNIYNPGHHGDESFYRAAVSGVTSHHWKFGNMPAQPQVSRYDMENVINFIREVQVENGIRYQAHKM
jgi:cytochrome c